MGTSFIGYHGRGFWAGDGKIDVWLFVLCVEIDGTEGLPDWLRRARDHWHRQATVGFVGCVSPSLDRHLGDDYGRVEELLILSERAQVG